jgi:hypothetical protein
MDYSVIDLGDLVPSGSCFPLSISSSGRLITGSAAGTTGFEAFLWQAGALSSIPGVTQFPNGTGFAVNANGDVAGTLRGAPDAPWPSHAFLKKAGAATFDIHDQFTPANTYVASLAYGLNDQGDTVGVRYILTLPTQQSAWVYSGGTVTDLTTLNAQAIEAWGINNSGLVVGRLSTSQVFLYDLSDATLTLLPLEVETREIFINNLGQLAGSMNDGTIFVYQPGGSTVVFDQSTTGYVEVAGFNNQGQIVVAGNSGVYFTDPLSTSATSAPPFIAVNPMLVDAGWVMTKAHGIDDHGCIIGAGKLAGGDERGILVTPPAIHKDIYQAAFATILFGIINDGGGLQIPGGKIGPGPEPGGPIWNALTTGQKDAVLGLALNAGASIISNRSMRSEMQSLSARLVRSASDQLTATPAARSERVAAESAMRAAVRSRADYLRDLRRQLAARK